MEIPKFIHLEDTPCVFYFSNDVFAVANVKQEVLDWFRTRKPTHFVKRLYNSEREKYGKDFCIIFDSHRDAVEFKMLFV